MGVVYALLAYVTWGVLPVYWKALAQVPADEIIAWRLVGTVAFTWGLLAGLGRLAELRAIGSRRRERVLLAAGGVLITSNWLVFIWAVNHDQLLEASFGYYLNPIFNVFLGRVFLGERLSPGQAAAVAIAAAGVGVLGWQFGGLPWVSLSLATSFGLYGLVHKLCKARPVPALGFETAVVGPLAALYLGLGVEPIGGGTLLLLDGTERWLLLAAGPATALPLLWFSSAARRMPLSVLGLFQYLSPSLSFLLALFVYDEPWTPTHALAFALIWSALILFTTDGWRRRSPST
jgi:chloramphenicol-sensitive protein RarD